MGLLAVDVTTHGVVMSADSQPVEICEGENRVDSSAGHWSRNPIIVRVGGGFVGLVGFVGTERIEDIETARWLRRFDSAWPSDDLETFCNRLASTLTDVWRRDALRSVLEILVTGEISGDLQFWFVRNSQGFREDGRFNAPADMFVTQDDLVANMRSNREPGETKDDVLARVTYSIRQGVLVPASPVFDAFSQLLRTIWIGQVEGFAPLSSLNDVGHFARVRMEFLKRLCTARYGIYGEDIPTPISGDVHVWGVGRDGRICKYAKHRTQTEVFRQGRP